MKIESEKLLERKLCKEIKDIGGWVIKLLSTITGLPDRLCLLPGGRLFFIEMKTTKKKPKKRQLFVHKQLRALGFTVLVLDTSEQIRDFIDKVKLY